MEFLLIFLMLLGYFQLVVIPSWEASVGTLRDVKKTAEVKLAAEKLADALDAVSAASGEASTEVEIFLPEDVRLQCLNISRQIAFGSLFPDFSSANCNNQGAPETSCGALIKLPDKVAGLSVNLTCNLNPAVSQCFFEDPENPGKFVKFGKSVVCPDVTTKLLVQKKLGPGTVNLLVNEIG